MIHITPAVPTSGLFMHTLADLTGGVTIASNFLGGAYLYAGTPIGKGSDGCYEVEKIACNPYGVQGVEGGQGAPLFGRRLYSGRYS